MAERRSWLCWLGFHSLVPTTQQPDPDVPLLRPVSVCTRCGVEVDGW